MLFVTTIFTVFLHIAVAERSSFSRTYDHTETQIITDFRETSDTTLAYVRCNDSLPKLGKQCVITAKHNAFEKLAGESKECPVNLKSELPHGDVKDILYVYAFGSDKVLLVWMETQKAADSEEQTERLILRTSVVHMFDNCLTFEASVETPLGRQILFTGFWNEPHLNVMLYDNTYELKIGYMKSDCRTGRECDLYYRLYKFDDHNGKIGEAEDWPKPLFNGTLDVTYSVPMKLRQPGKAYFVINENFTNFDVEQHGTSIIVERMDKKSNDNQRSQFWESSCDSSHMRFQWSVLNEAIGFCHECANKSIECWKSDQEGQIHTRGQFNLDFPHESNSLAVHNLRNGGLLIAVSKCSDSDKDCHGYTSQYNDGYHLIEIDTTGNVKSVGVQFEAKCYYNESSFHERAFENKQGQYCVARLCESTPITGKELAKSVLETSVNCYSSDEFSKCTNCH